MAISVRIEGVGKTKDYLAKVSNRVHNISNLEFAQYLKQEAEKNLQVTIKGWPNPDSSGIHFAARTAKLAKGSEIVLMALAVGADGYRYANVQETGFDASRTAKGGKLMRFMTPEGTWVSKREVGPIPAKGYMLQTAIWAGEAYPRYIELKVEDALRR